MENARLLRRAPGARGIVRTLVDSDVLHASGTIAVSHSDSALSTVPASHDALIKAGRGFPSVVPSFLTEADSDDSDQDCGPEVVPVDTEDEPDSG